MGANTPEYNRNYAKDRRAKLRKRGICVMCSVRVVKPGCVNCRVCIKAATERNRVKQQAGEVLT